MVDKWYNTEFFSACLGAIIAIITFIIGHCINSSVQKKNDIRNLIILLTQTNQELFNLIYIGSKNKDQIDYVKLREQLQKTSIIYLMPNSLKQPFIKLYEIYFTNPEYYSSNKKNIHKHLEEIVQTLKKYERYFK